MVGCILTEDMRTVLGQQLRKIRTEKNISQEELAFRSGLHRTYISSVERGKRNVSIVNIKKIADALGVSVMELFPDNNKIK